MNIAWSTVAFLVLLLPGFLFFTGIALSDHFTRETAPRSPLTQLALIVFVSFGVHALLFAILGSIAWERIPPINLDDLLQLLQVEGISNTELPEITGRLQENRWWILSYMLGTSGLGLWIGFETGCLIVSGPFRRLGEHPWVYDLKVQGGSDRPFGLLSLAGRGIRRLTPQFLSDLGKTLNDRWRGEIRPVSVAYVLTKIGHERRFIMYRGFLRTFALSKDGKLLYVVLDNARRSYMILGGEEPRTSKEWPSIGGASAGNADLPPRLSSYLTINGEEIANVVFDRHEYRQAGGDLKKLEQRLADDIKIADTLQGQTQAGVAAALAVRSGQDT